MSDIRLPQRPMVELPPPSDGLDQVRGEAGRRRRRRAGVIGASLTTAAGVAVAVALSGGSGGLAVLKPAPPAAPGLVQPTPTVTGAAGVARASQHHQVRAGQPSGSGHKVGHAGHAARSGHGTETLSPPTDATPLSNGQVSRAQQPTLSRWPSTYKAGGVQQCSGTTNGGTDGSFKTALGWCLNVLATPASGGVRLYIQLCRDSTGGGTLSYSGSREVDLAVRQGNRTIWDWAKLHPGGSAAHQMSVAANGCWNWSLVWPDVTQAGGSAGHGNFTFVGTSTADEMKGGDSQSAVFSY